ncbi:phage antirepressor N-terminal domain-containing protein [Acinetobacter seifertii]|uniref:phage antirepressor N-terminal domain-containing protein n=1 Tax=Acinetobacter seifertii TaxID=1530123 RepID=UPI0032B32402
MKSIDNKKARDLGGQGLIDVNTGILTMSNVAQITVPFHNNNLYIVEFNGQPYTPLRQIVQGMGLDWASQFTKIKQKFATCVVEITMQILGDDQSRPHTCIPVRKLAAWLYSVNPNKVKPELRDNVIMYQSECDDVLWDYWTKGQAINQRAAITPEQQALLHEIVARRSNGERKIFAEMWSRHNKHFKIPRYSELLAIHFPESVHYLETMEIKSKPEQIEQKDVVGKLDEYLKNINSRYPALKCPYAYEAAMKLADDLKYRDVTKPQSYYVSFQNGNIITRWLEGRFYPVDMIELSEIFEKFYKFSRSNDLLEIGRNMKAHIST